jgi:hypothetical protein
MARPDLLIRLTPAELSRCKQAAALRWQLARASGVVDQRRDSSRQLNDLDLLGVKAEQAVAKALDLEYTPTALGIDDGADLYAGDVSIDVKATFYPTGKLLLRSQAQAKAHVFVLVAAVKDEEAVMRLCGWISRREFLAQCKTIDLGHGPGLAMEQSDLRHLTELWGLLVTRRHGPNPAFAA